MPTVSLVARATLAFLALPGVVAYAVPLAWAAAQGGPIRHASGAAAVIAGSAGLLWCVRDFLVQGGGTLAPWDPPRRLVRDGLYRFTRNPMYVSVAFVLAGWAAVFGSPGLALYAGMVALAFHLRVVLGEEPWLERTHGTAWRAYAARVPRWLW